MNLAEYEHMMEIYTYVFSTPPNSPERDKRLEEISKEDNDKLWDFYSGLCSGRIKKPEATNKESEVGTMNTENKIKNYDDFKAAWGKTRHYQQLAELHRRCPELYDSYRKRMEKEQLKANDAIGYYLQYGGDQITKRI